MENENYQTDRDEWRENLQLENEILKLKMMAERGAYFGENAEDIPPEVEAQFLRNVQLFEDCFDKAEEISIYEYIGRPQYKDVSGLTAEEITGETKRIENLLYAKNIVIDVEGQYEPSVIYKFITDELFYEKIRPINIPGFIQHFPYEEFHPNHALDIGNAEEQFFINWFEKGFNEYSSKLADKFITVEGNIYSKEEVLQKLNDYLGRYRRLNNIKFGGSNVNFEWDDKEDKGIGHAEGIFSCDAEIETGEVIHIEGPYKLYMMNEFGLWEIFYFVFPGFAW